MISHQIGENTSSVFNLETNLSQFESPHCLMTFPEEVKEMKEPNPEASQGVLVGYEKKIKSMLEEVELHISKSHLKEVDTTNSDSIVPLMPASKEQGDFTETSSNNEKARSQKELSDVIVAKMTRWEEQSSKQATAEKGLTHLENEPLERNEPEKCGNKPNRAQNLEMKEGAENQSNLKGRNRQEAEEEISPENRGRDVFTQQERRNNAKNGLNCPYYTAGRRCRGPSSCHCQG
jgi:hypothetical protein